MRRLTIFGESYSLKVRRGDKDSVHVVDGEVVVLTRELSPDHLLENFLADTLYRKLCEIFDQVRKEGRAEVFGNVDFEVVKSLDGNERRVAKLKGHVVRVKLGAVALPEPALKYVIAHELAHIVTKKHSERFWRIVEAIYPNYREGQELLVRYGEKCKDAASVME